MTDWLIVIIPVLLVVYVGFKAQKYVKAVSDFLAAGRVAGRVIGHVSADDVAVVEKVEHVVIQEVHEAEKAPAEELKEQLQEDAEHKSSD